MSSKPTPESKQSRDDMGSTGSEDDNGMPTAFTPADREMLQTIFTQLQKLDILEELKTDVVGLKQSVEHNNALIEDLKIENKSLKKEVKVLTSVTSTLTNDNVKLKANLLDLQCRGMRNNLLFMGIEEKEKETYETSEAIVKNFMHQHLKIPVEEVRKIQLERVHRLGPRKENSKFPRPLVAIFANCKCKDQVLGLSKNLKGTRFYLSNQYPAEIVERRRNLIPIMNSFRQKGKKARLVVDKLYVDGELYRGDYQQSGK